MSKMKATDKQVMEILKKLDELIDSPKATENNRYAGLFVKRNRRRIIVGREDKSALNSMAAEKRRLDNALKRNAAPEIPVPEEDSVALLFYDAGDYRVFPFEHVLRICPWLNEHSVMRAIPGVKDLYYLYEEGTEIKTESGLYLVGPIVR